MRFCGKWGLVEEQKNEKPEEKQYLITDHKYQTNGASRDPCCAICNEEWYDHKYKGRD